MTNEDGAVGRDERPSGWVALPDVLTKWGSATWAFTGVIAALVGYRLVITALMTESVARQFNTSWAVIRSSGVMARIEVRATIACAFLSGLWVGGALAALSAKRLRARKPRTSEVGELLLSLGLFSALLGTVVLAILVRGRGDATSRGITSAMPLPCAVLMILSGLYTGKYTGPMDTNALVGWAWRAMVPLASFLLTAMSVSTLRISPLTSMPRVFLELTDATDVVSPLTETRLLGMDDHLVYLLTTVDGESCLVGVAADRVRSIRFQKLLGE